MPIAAGKMIAAERVKNGLSREQLAEKVDIATETLARYERGDRTPRPQIAERLASVLNVTTDYLMGREDTKKEPAPEGELNASGIHIDNIIKQVYSFSVYKFSLMRGEEYPTMDSKAGNCFHTTEKLSGLDKDHPPFIVEQDKNFRMKRTANFEPTDRILVDPLQTKIEPGKIYLVSYQGESLVCQIRKNGDGQYQLLNDGQPIDVASDDLATKRLVVVGKVVSRWTEYDVG
jgi:transcriptional regulator with XRE-family HTH domain